MQEKKNGTIPLLEICMPWWIYRNSVMYNSVWWSKQWFVDLFRALGQSSLLICCGSFLSFLPPFQTGVGAETQRALYDSSQNTGSYYSTEEVMENEHLSENIMHKRLDQRIILPCRPMSPHIFEAWHLIWSHHKHVSSVLLFTSC